MRHSHKYLALALFIFLIYLVSTMLQLDGSPKVIQMLMLTISLLLIGYYFLLKRKGRLTPSNLVKLTLLLGCLLRIGYTLYTRCDIRQHDLGLFDPDSPGNAGYILTLMQSHKLPDTNNGQFYQPPLFHLLSALISSVVNRILGHKDYPSYINASKIVSCFASCALLFLCNDLGDELQLKPSNKLLALLIIAFSPALIIISATVNNDALVTFFIVLSILYTYRWQKEQSYKNTIILALCFGLGMMTKLSMGVFALFTAIIMLNTLRRYLHENMSLLKECLLKLVCFGLISFPLGLWFHIRNYIRFHQPFGYVLRISEAEPIFCGDAPLFQRFITVNMTNLLATPYVDPYQDFNYPAYLLKSALFGEYHIDIPLWIPIILLFLNILLSICLLWAFYCLSRSHAAYPPLVRSGMISLWLLTVISNLYFNIKYPFGCTMDFRYMFLALITGAFIIALTYKTGAFCPSPQNILYQKIMTIYELMLPHLILLFSFFSFIMFAFMS